MPMELKIVIVGAGPGGLMLAALLQKHSIPFIVLESDRDANSRSQGGSLDIHTDSGQRALKAAGLHPAFQEHMRVEGQAFRLIDVKRNVLIESDSGFEHRPEIDRSRLRDILLSGIDPSNIRWGCKVSGVKETSQGIYAVDIVNGSPIEDVNVLVGADGAWSKVRKLVSDETPYYSGVCGLEIWSRDVDKRKPGLAKLTGKGTTFTFDGNVMLAAQRSGDGSVRTFAWILADESWKEKSGIDWTDPANAKQGLADGYFRAWEGDARRLLMETDDEMVFRYLYMLPVGFTWGYKPGVTLLGDAAHLMTPFAGVGVNIALMDALELFEAIADITHKDGSNKACEPSELTTALVSYEKQMQARSKEGAVETFKNMKDLMADDARDRLYSQLKAAFG